MRSQTSSPLRRVRASFLVLVVAMLGALVIVGCGSTTRITSTGAQRTLRMGVVALPNIENLKYDSLDPVVAFDPASSFIASLVFPTLLTTGAQLQLEPWAATSVPTFDTANDTYTFHLKPHLTWSDGTPITAATYAYSLNRALTSCILAQGDLDLYPIQGAQAFANEKCAADGVSVEGPITSLIGQSLLVVDPQTLVIKLTAPAPYFLAALATPVASAVPEQLITRYGPKEWVSHLSDGKGFGGNLYDVTSWDDGAPSYTEAHVTLACRAACQAKGFPTFGNRDEPPMIHSIAITTYSDPSQQQSDYTAGRLDTEMMFTPLDGIPAQAAKMQSAPALTVTALWLYTAAYPTTPLSDAQLRQALALALDKDALTQAVTQGTVIPTNHLVPEGMAGYDANLVGPDGSTSTSGNLARAQALMRQYAAAHCGGRLSACPPVVINYSCDPVQYPVERAYLEDAVQAWQQAFPGYPISLDTGVSFGCPPFFTPDSDMPISTATANYADPQDFLSNYEGWPVAPANTLLLAGDENLNPSQRIAEYNQAEQLLVNAAVAIPLAQGETYFAAQPSVSGFGVTGLGYPSLDQMYSMRFD